MSAEKARKALRILDFRHKKRRPLTSIDVPMVRRPDSNNLFNHLISILFILKDYSLYPHLYPQTKIRTKSEQID